VARDVVVEAIDDVASAVHENVNDQEELLAELARMRQERVEGVSLGKALGEPRRPRALVILDRIVNRLTLGSARLRRALITSLVQEGQSVTSVATRFEVTHQRISSILRRGND